MYISGSSTLVTSISLDLIIKKSSIVPSSSAKNSTSIFAGALISYGITQFYQSYKDTGALFYDNPVGIADSFGTP